MMNNYIILLWRKAKTWSILFWANVLGFIIGLSLVELVLLEFSDAIRIQAPWGPASALAFTVLVIVTFNYANFTALEIRKRFNEASLRKLLGAEPRQIIMQFMMESIVVVFISVLMSLILTELIEPLFNQLFGISAALRDQSILFQLGLAIMLTLWLSIIGAIIPVWRFAHITIKDMLPNLKILPRKL
jgi:predicted lysophospholipase L1 biosynthesis ABC-type transport system permease subunit